MTSSAISKETFEKISFQSRVLGIYVAPTIPYMRDLWVF